MTEGRWIKVPDEKYCWMNFPCAWSVSIKTNKIDDQECQIWVEPLGSVGYKIAFTTIVDALEWITDTFQIKTENEVEEAYDPDKS